MLFFNNDSSHFPYNCYNAGIRATEKIIKDYIYQYRGTQITDFCLDVNCTASAAESNIFETYAEKHTRKEENGIAVDYSDSWTRILYEMREDGLDLYRIWVETLREIGIRPWISFRMNDSHDNLLPTSPIKSTFVEKYPERWRVRHRTPTKYFDRNLDYALPEVREYMLSYIDEMLNKYAPDGIELDFIREKQIFAVGSEYDNISILTDFIADVRKLTERAEEKFGHPIMLGLLIPDNAGASLSMGFDVKTWCDRGLVDFVTACCRWETINTSPDIPLWKRLTGDNVKFGTGFQVLVRPTEYEQPTLVTAEHDFGQAVANLSLGADYIYLYNHFDSIEEAFKEAGVKVSDSCAMKSEFYRDIIHNIANLESAMKFRRRHILTWDDFYPDWERASVRLPLTVDSSYKNPTPCYAQIRIAVGKTYDESTLTLQLGFTDSPDAEKLHIYVNSHKVDFIGCSERFDGKGNTYCFKIPSGIIKTYAVIELGYDGMSQLNYAEIIVE